MSFALIFRIQGFLLVMLGVSMCAPPLIGIAYGQYAQQPFIHSILITLLSGLALILCLPSRHKQISQREGFLIVSLGWIMASLFGSLPFLLNGTFATLTEACFETVSGFTTTGSTVLANIEGQPLSILFWRSMIQWLGGMGIILFSIAILPMLGIGGMQLFKAEVPGPVVEKIKPRIAETARSLWKVYALLSLVMTLLLMLCGMNLFDALCHTFTTMATGGFSTRNQSIESFGNPMIEAVILVFMFAAGMNFILHYRLLHGKFKSLRMDREFLVYLSITLAGIWLISMNLHDRSGESLFTSFRHGAFQVVSILTTTGYSSANFDSWPNFSRLILLLLMFVGGCAGSTAGGIKCIRGILVCKSTYRELFYAVHPHAVSSIKIAGKAIPDPIVRAACGFVLLYVLIFIVGSFGMALCGLDMVSAVSAAAACLGNIGPGFAAVGPYENFLFIPTAGKWILIMLMLVGRLEIYTLLILLVPEFWRK
jgi:trk system potassium uptake protein TrkH